MSEKLQELTGLLFDAKKAESEAKEKRVEIEKKIAALIETSENGSKTVDAGNGIKVTVKRELSYKADINAIRALDIPEEVMPLKTTDPVPAGYEFDKKAYENVRENHPDIAAMLSEFVATTPRKVSITLKLG